ncbi:MAG TPA: ATP-binding protein [Solirubrobacterales bacterium]
MGARAAGAIDYEGTWVVPAEADRVAELRAHAQELLEAHGIDAATLSDVSVAISEAATNVVVHAYVDREPGPMELRVEIRHGAVVVTVADRGRGMQPRADSPGLGIGLPLIGKLASAVDMRAGPDGVGTEISMTFDVPGLVGRPSVRDEEGRLAMLARIAALTESADWPAAGYQSLVELLVPELADACAIDLLEEDSRARRLGARVAFDDELSEWLAARAPVTAEIEATVPDLLVGRPRVIRVDDPDALAKLSHDEDDRARMEELGLRYWIVLPLIDDGAMLGSLGLGLRPERGHPRPMLSFLRAAADRVARGIARERITHDLRAAGARYEGILRHLGAAVTVHDREGRNIYANDAAVRLLGAESAEEVISSPPGTFASRFIMTREDGSPVRYADLPGNRLGRGEDAPPLLTRSVERVSGREYWLLTRATMIDPERGLIANIIEDVTESKTEELRQRVLARAGELFVSPRGYDETLRSLAEIPLPEIAEWCAIDVLEDGELRRAALVHTDPAKEELIERLLTRWPPRLEAEGSGVVARTGEPQLYREITDATLRAGAQSDEHLELLRGMGLRSAVVVPIRAGDEVLAALTLASAESRRCYDDGDLAFAQEFARRAAAALAGARNRDR